MVIGVQGRLTVLDKIQFNIKIVPHEEVLGRLRGPTYKAHSSLHLVMRNMDVVESSISIGNPNL